MEEREEIAMSDSARSTRTRTSGASGGAVYGLGVIGAVVFFWQQADSLWEYVLAVLKALVWPAILVYEALEVLLG